MLNFAVEVEMAEGFPFNAQREVYDASMLTFGLALSADLSQSLGAPISRVLSHRDVPGMTRSVIPTLLRHNVSAISIGVNGGSAPPGTRLLCLGIESYYNWSFLRMLRKLSRGFSYAMVYSERINHEMDHLLRMADTPVLTDIEVELKSFERQIPDLFIVRVFMHSVVHHLSPLPFA